MERNALHREAIQSWMARVLAAQPATPFDDLHIDQVDEAYVHRSSWLRGAIACLETAVFLRDARSLPVILALGVGLRPGTLPRGVTFRTWLELEEELDDAPPSLYLWGRNEDPVGINATRVLDLTDVLSVPTSVRARKLLSEWLDPADGEFRRTVWMLA